METKLKPPLPPPQKKRLSKRPGLSGLINTPDGKYFLTLFLEFIKLVSIFKGRTTHLVLNRTSFDLNGQRSKYSVLSFSFSFFD